MHARALEMSRRLAAAAVLGVVLAVIANAAPVAEAGRGTSVGRRDREPAAPVVTTLHHRHDGALSGSGGARLDAEACSPGFGPELAGVALRSRDESFVWWTFAVARGAYRGPAPPVRG
jgi:hypothetical protein